MGEQKGTLGGVLVRGGHPQHSRLHVHRPGAVRAAGDGLVVEARLPEAREGHVRDEFEVLYPRVRALTDAAPTPDQPLERLKYLVDHSAVGYGLWTQT